MKHHKVKFVLRETALKCSSGNYLYSPGFKPVKKLDDSRVFVHALLYVRIHPL